MDVFKKIIKYFILFISALVGLFIVLALCLRLPSVQNFVKDKLVNYLEEKIHTDVSLERVYVNFPNNLELENLYLQGQKVDTLLYAQSFEVGLNIPKLISNTVDITSVDLKGVKANVVRNEDGSFNFDYIVDAFAKDEEEEKPSKPFIISLDKIKLENIGVSFIDDQSRRDINIYFNSFNTRVKTFDLEKNSYAVGDLTMDGLKLNLKQDLAKEVAKEVEEKSDSLIKQSPLQIGLENVNLTNFDVKYGDDNSKTYAEVIFKELAVGVDELDIQKQIYKFDEALLKSANIDAQLFLPENKVEETNQEINHSDDDVNNTLALLVNKFLLQDVSVKYDNTAASHKRQGIDFNHLDLAKIDLDLEDFTMQNGQFSGEIESAEIKEKVGLHVQKLRTQFQFGEKQAYLKNLYLKTPKTLLRDQVILNYQSIEQLSSNLGKVDVLVNIPNSQIGVSDILRLAPDLRDTAPFSTHPNAIVKLDARARGEINDLLIQNLQVSGIEQLVINASGRIKNALDENRLFYDLAIRELSASSRTINAIAPKGAIPNSITLPNHTSLKGKVKGTTKVINADLLVNSTSGNAVIDASVDMSRKNRERYTIKASLQRLAIGKIIQNKEVGKITGDVFIDGVGFDMETAIADLSGDVKSLNYNGYTYRNMALDGKINNGLYTIDLDSKDPNASMKIYASGSLKEGSNSLEVNGSINKIDLYKLGFYDEPLVIKGDIEGNIDNMDLNHLNGSVQLKNFSLSDSEGSYPIDEMLIYAKSSPENDEIAVESAMADVRISGQFQLLELKNSLLSTLNSYYQFNSTLNARPSKTPQIVDLKAEIKDDRLFTKFVAGLDSFQPISINGSYNSEEQNIELFATIPQVIYGANEIKNGRLAIDNQNQALTYQLNVEQLINENIALEKVDIHGDIQNNTITYNASSIGENDEKQFLIAGNVEKLDDVMDISLDQNGLILNYDQWYVEPNNSVEITSQSLYAEDFVLSHQGSKIALQSESRSINSPLNVSLKDFKIETITEMIKKDSLLAKGTINGNAKISNLLNDRNINLSTDLAITDLIVYGSPVGNLSLDAKNTSPDKINLNANLTGFGNEVQVHGFYTIEQGGLNVMASIAKLQMETIQGFSRGELENAEGYLSGNIEVKGTTDQPQPRGELKFNNVGLGITQIGSKFKNINDNIEFTNRGIDFNKFTIYDESGNPIIIRGAILTKKYEDFAFQLDIDADDFKLVDSEEDYEKLMYGILTINSKLEVRGDMDLPKVQGKIDVADNTDFTFVLPQSTPSLEERVGIVEFVDEEEFGRRIQVKTDSLYGKTEVKGLDVNVTIEIGKEAKISLLIDKANGDFVNLQGEAQLTAGIDPSGKTTLVGVYEVEEGSYKMSVNPITREFDIKKGSTITWTGEPMTADLAITAIYKTKAAPLDLLQQQLTGVSGRGLNQYKQRIPFNTLLQMRGELLKPDIEFDITTDEQNSSVSGEVIDNTQAKLEQLRRDKSELNKQVFALLLLNRFIGENPFQSETGVSASTMAKQSVSRILNEQLNQLAEDLIQGVDLDFNLSSTEDFSSGERNERTDLNVKLSKRLFNDRLKVSLGNNFMLDGDARQNEQITNIAGDITLDYSLSKDGRYMLRAYRKNDYQVALQGQVIETGLGFIITLDYDEFKEIFEKSKKK